LGRIPQLPAILFKGSGWYSTDHRPASEKGGKLNQQDGQVGSASGAKSER
jgi:predicted nucleic acid-binding Zn ribbon protein